MINTIDMGSSGVTRNGDEIVTSVYEGRETRQWSLIAKLMRVLQAKVMYFSIIE